MIIEPAHRLEAVSEYYFSGVLNRIDDMRSQGADVINLGIGNPDLSPSDATIQALIDSARNPGHHGYQNYRGTRGLRQAMADWYRRVYNVVLDSENEVLPLLGSKEGIFYIAMAFLNSEDEVLVPDPGYPVYRAAAKLAGATVRSYRLREDMGWMPDLADLERTDLSHTKILWLNYPHMPTGAQASRAFLSDLVKFAHERSVLICHDNPYSMILPTEAPCSILSVEGAKDVAVELNSLSKSHNMAGWRVGWVSGKREYLDAILKVKSNVDSGMFLPVQHAAIEALQDTDLWHRQRNAEYSMRRERLWQFLDILSCRYQKNQVGMFVWAKIPAEFPNSEHFANTILQNAHICVTPGTVFGESGERFIRVSMCASAERIEEACHRARRFARTSVPVTREAQA